MSLRDRLAAAAEAIADEIEHNKGFRKKMEDIFQSPLSHGEKARDARQPVDGAVRKGGRRTPSIVDPVALAREGEAVLRRRLAGLNYEQLRDVVADHGMDPGKLVMKWKDRDRITERIVELAMARSTKGDAFRADKPAGKPTAEE